MTKLHFLTTLVTIISVTHTATLVCSAQGPDKKLSEEIEAAHIEQIFSLREKEPFDKAIAKAKSDGMSEQVILEARFLYYIDKEDYKAIALLTDEFENKTDNFDPDHSKIFSTKEDWLSVVEYGKALQALENDNLVEFKKHITEAFWLSPDKASAFSHHITTYRTEAAMQNITLDLNREITQIKNENPTTLKTILVGQEAVILRYWSPWNQQASNTDALMQHIAQISSKHKVAFASILLTPEKQAVADAKDVISELGETFPSYWLVDSENDSLAKKLRISDLPTLVIVSPTGKILYNGSPLTDEFWATLKTINPAITPPAPGK